MSTGTTTPKISLPSANPLPLSASQEAEVRQKYYANVRGKCDAQVSAFAQCAKGRTFTMLWTCRTQQHAMNECMLRHATPEEMDRAREQWFQDRAKKTKERKEQMAREDEERRQGKRL